jgi:hypothetical protein
MNSFNAFSPLIRRSAQVPWTCHSCLRRQIPQLRNGFATKTNTSAKLPVNAGKSYKKRRRLLVVGGGFAIAGAAVTINDDAKHAYTAVQRSSRVLSTLFINVKE